MAYKKILILDFSRIGDTLMHDPALRALKLQFPQAQFFAYTDKPNFELLAHHPAISEAKIFPRKVKNFKSLCAFIQTLLYIRKQKFDLLVNFYMGGATPMIARFSGIPLRLAFDRKKELRRTHNLLATNPSKYSNWIVETNEIVRPLGIDPAAIWPKVKFFVSDEDRNWVPSALPTQAGVQYAAYQLATSDPIKCWPPSKYAELAAKLYHEKSLIPVVIGSPDQMPRVDEFIRHLPKEIPHIRLPVLGLAKLGALLQFMDILITGDTGIMHLGFAVDTPTCCIFTNGRPEYAVSATTNKMVVFREDETEPKYPSGQLHGTKDLRVEEVYQAALTLLSLSA